MLTGTPSLSTYDRTADPFVSLDGPLPADWTELPLIEETRSLFRHVRDHDFEPLAKLCDDDFGIVDLDPRGMNVLVETREEWEAWFQRLFSEMQTVGAATDTEIQRYQVVVDEGGSLAYGVVGFTQLYSLGGKTARFRCVVTIIWKHTLEGWRESRWHVSLLGVDMPDGFGQ